MYIHTCTHTENCCNQCVQVLATDVLLLLTTNSERVVVQLDLLQKFRHVVNIIYDFGMSHNSANMQQQTLVFFSVFPLQ